MSSIALASPRQLNKTVTTAGTRVQLSATPVLALSICIQANSVNGGDIFIGTSTVSSSAFMARLPPRASFTIELPGQAVNAMEVDLADIWIDSSTSGDGVSVSYYVRG